MRRTRIVASEEHRDEPQLLEPSDGFAAAGFHGISDADGAANAAVPCDDDNCRSIDFLASDRRC